jgi:hypothetical protein
VPGFSSSTAVISGDSVASASGVDVALGVGVGDSEGTDVDVADGAVAAAIGSERGAVVAGGVDVGADTDVSFVASLATGDAPVASQDARVIRTNEKIASSTHMRVERMRLRIIDLCIMHLTYRAWKITSSGDSPVFD